MKQFGKPVGSGPDLFDMVVMAVVVAFMLTLAAQVSAAPVSVQVDVRIPSNGLPSLIDPLAQGRISRLQHGAQYRCKGSNSLRTMAISVPAAP